MATMTRIWAPKMRRLTSMAGIQETFSPLMTNAPTGLATNPKAPAGPTLSSLLACLFSPAPPAATHIGRRDDCYAVLLVGLTEYATPRNEILDLLDQICCCHLRLPPTNSCCSHLGFHGSKRGPTWDYVARTNGVEACRVRNHFRTSTTTISTAHTITPVVTTAATRPCAAAVPETRL